MLTKFYLNIFTSWLEKRLRVGYKISPGGQFISIPMLSRVYIRQFCTTYVEQHLKSIKSVSDVKFESASYLSCKWF